MRAVSSATTATWQAGIFVGSTKPMVRATIQRLHVQLNAAGNQVYSSIPFGQASIPVEIPNLRSLKWNRTVDGGVATMTMTLFNCELLPLGASPTRVELDQPGFFTPTRGKTTYSSRWAHASNPWQDWLVPDRLIRTYEGYGFNPAVIPESDANLYQSGIWMIDDVTFDDTGVITIEARDIGRALIDQILLPPIVPTASYPLWFQKPVAVANPPITTTTGSGWVRPTYDTSSNVPWVGQSAIFGHVAGDAFDSNASSYWLSVGNGAPEDQYSFEWVQGKFSSQTLSAVRVTTWAGPYQVYVSVYAAGKWQGNKTVPYNPHNPVAYPNGADIRFSWSFNAVREGSTTFNFPTPIPGATKVRVTFTKLSRSAIGPYYYRAGLRTLEVSSSVTTTVDGGSHLEPDTTPPGVNDYTDIVKILLAYAGWHWAPDAARAFLTESDGSRVTLTPSSSDAVLKLGRVWGDFEESGTMSVTALGVDYFDKKPVLDVITAIRDVLGFIFYIDETGGAVFRSQNIWSVGNYVGDTAATAGRTTDVVTIDESQTLMSASVKLSSRSIRERIFVGNLAGQIGAMTPGQNPYPSGLRRVAAWIDQHFTTAAECQIMSDLIGLRQLFTFRSDTVKIPGYPGIQVDDQVRIYERVTEEGYLHYVTDISMTWDIETGRYEYDLGTHWLGDVAFSNWTFNPDTLAAETQAYLHALGKI